MVLRNDYVLKLFNGDVGIVAPDATNALVVHFPDGAGFRPVPPARLPEHGTAFAMTVHKAQGSEFEHVLLMLPARASRVLTRELLYTGLTRARSRATIVAGAAELETAIASPTRRYSGLLARLRQVEVRAGSATGA
jgi:exodeoxyribonuclease V alpha subunit